MEIITIDEAKTRFPSVDFSVPEDFIILRYEEKLNENSETTVIAFSKNMGKAFIYKGLEAYQVIVRFENFKKREKDFSSGFVYA
jgi:hypothetical protein